MTRRKGKITGDWHNHIYILNPTRPGTGRKIFKKNISYNTLPDEWKKQEFALGKAYNDKYIPDAPFKPDAAWGLRELRKQGHKIFIITARTDDYYDDAVKATTLELNNGGIAYDKLICTADKAGACVAESISILIDDAPFNCQAAKEAGITPILFESKAYPNAGKDFLHAADWKQAVALVKQLENTLRNAWPSKDARYTLILYFVNLLKW